MKKSNYIESYSHLTFLELLDKLLNAHGTGGYVELKKEVNARYLRIFDLYAKGSDELVAANTTSKIRLDQIRLLVMEKASLEAANFNLQQELARLKGDLKLQEGKRVQITIELV